jgi:hypothetical protein
MVTNQENLQKLDKNIQEQNTQLSQKQAEIIGNTTSSYNALQKSLLETHHKYDHILKKVEEL